MSDEQVKGIQRYDMIAVTRCGEGWQELQREPEGEWMCYEDHEQALAALEAENATLKSFQCNFEHATSLERAENEQQVAALEARNRELEAALRRLIGACVRPNGMLQPPDVDSEYAGSIHRATAETHPRRLAGEGALGLRQVR